MRNKFLITTTLLAPLCAGQASAQDIDFGATLNSVCTLPLPTNGAMGLSSNGTVLGSEETGGLPASISVLSIGSSTLTVGAPNVVSAPAEYDNTGETVEVKYLGASGLSGVSQEYTDSQTTVAIGTVPLSLLTFNARVTNANSFAGGDYTVRTVVTCS